MSGDYALVLPEIILAVGAMALLMFAVYGGEERQTGRVVWASAALMAALGIWIASGGAPQGVAFNGDFVVDGFTRFTKSLILLSSALMLLLGEGYLARRKVL